MNLRSSFMLFAGEDSDLIAELAPLVRYERARRIRTLLRSALAIERGRSTGAANLPAQPSTPPAAAIAPTTARPQSESAQATVDAPTTPVQSEPATPEEKKKRVRDYDPRKFQFKKA